MATSNTTMHPTTTTTTTLTPPTACSNPSTTHHITKPSQHTFLTSTMRFQSLPHILDPQPCVIDPQQCVFNSPASSFNPPACVSTTHEPSTTHFDHLATDFEPQLRVLSPPQHLLSPSSIFRPPAWFSSTHDPCLDPQHTFSAPTMCFQPPPSFLHPRDMHIGVFSSFFFFFFFLCTLGTCICMFLGFSLFLCTPGTHRRVFPGLVFYFIYFLFFPCTRNTAYHVSGAFFCLFSFFAPPGHVYVCFGGLFILFLSLHPRTCVICMFAGVFSSFLFLVPLCTPATHFDQQTRVMNPQTCVSNPWQPVSATYNPNPHVSTIYDPQPHVHWHPRPQNAHTSNCMCISSFVYFFLASETCVQAVVHVFLMFLFILFYFIPPETHV